jgi:hypothetical protein
MKKCICGHTDRYHVMAGGRFSCDKCACPEFRPITPHEKEVIKLLKEILNKLDK